MKKIIALLILFALAGSLSGCGRGLLGLDLGFGNSFVYDHAGKYTAGDGEIDGTVKKLDIDWLSGSVSVVAGNGDSVLIREAAGGKIDKDMRVHWWLDGTTLRVKFCASGLKPRIYHGKKDLTVTVPETLSLSAISVDSASAEVSVLGASMDELSVDTASGAIRVDTDCGLQSLRTDSASGEQDIKVRSAVSAELDAASGKISLTADTVRNLDIDTASGDVLCRLRKTPDDGSIDTASGKVAVVLPEDAAFTLKLSTASGKMNSDFAMKKSGSTYVCGSGDGRLHIDTASGAVSLFAE